MLAGAGSSVGQLIHGEGGSDNRIDEADFPNLGQENTSLSTEFLNRGRHKHRVDHPSFLTGAESIGGGSHRRIR